MVHKLVFAIQERHALEVMKELEMLVSIGCRHQDEFHLFSYRFPVMNEDQVWPLERCRHAVYRKMMPLLESSTRVFVWKLLVSLASRKLLQDIFFLKNPVMTTGVNHQEAPQTGNNAIG
jgi:hypothetical protein